MRCPNLNLRRIRVPSLCVTTYHNFIDSETDKHTLIVTFTYSSSASSHQMPPILHHKETISLDSRHRLGTPGHYYCCQCSKTGSYLRSDLHPASDRLCPGPGLGAPVRWTSPTVATVSRPKRTLRKRCQRSWPTFR